ncbi:hypothetical protein LQW54_009453 [Pestalotiopsis sp. IQ-011]
MSSSPRKDDFIQSDDLESATPAQEEVEPPDGGVTAWMQVLCTHIVFFNTWGISNGYGVFQQYYLQIFADESASTISWIGSVQGFLIFFIGVAAGRLSDSGHFRITFYSGVFLQVFGLFMASLASTYYQILLSQAICVGFGSGLTFCPALAIMSQYFKRNRAVSVGFAAAGAPVGGLVYPIIIDQMINHRQAGLPWTLRTMAFVMLVTYIPCIFLLRPRLPARQPGPWLDTTAFKDVTFVLFSIGFFLNFLGLYFVFFYLGTFARDQLGIRDTVFLIIILNGVGILGRMSPGIIADKWVGMLNSIIFLSLSTSLLVYCWAAVSSESGLLVFTVIYGLLAATLQALLPAAATTMTPEPSRTGTRVGMILCLVSFGNLTGPSICGSIISRQDGSYLGAQMFAGTSILLGAFMVVAARISRSGFVLKIKV